MPGTSKKSATRTAAARTAGGTKAGGTKAGGAKAGGTKAGGTKAGGTKRGATTAGAAKATSTTAAKAPGRRTAVAKTVPTGADVAAYLDARATPAQRPDCDALVALFTRITRAPATMWGPSIVGFGRYAYRYESGHTGESCLAGFAVRGREIVLYLGAEGAPDEALLAALGPHRMGKGCLYLKRLADVDMTVLERFAAGAVAARRTAHGVA